MRSCEFSYGDIRDRVASKDITLYGEVIYSSQVFENNIIDRLVSFNKVEDTLDINFIRVYIA